MMACLSSEDNYHLEAAGSPVWSLVISCLPPSEMKNFTLNVVCTFDWLFRHKVKK